MMVRGGRSSVVTWKYGLSSYLDKLRSQRSFRPHRRGSRNTGTTHSKSTACGAGARENIARLSQADTSTPLLHQQLPCMYARLYFCLDLSHLIHSACQGVDQPEPDVHRKESLDTSILLDICVTLLITKLLVL